MSLNIKEQIITSSNIIKNKLKQLRDIEDQNNLELNKIFKPVTEPLTQMIESNQNNVKCDFNVRAVQVPVCLDNVITSTPSKPYNKQSLDEDASTDHVDSDSEYYTDTDNIDNKDVSITKKYLSSLYDINIPFGVRKVGEQLKMGNLAVKIISSHKSDEEPCKIKIDEDEYQLTAGLKEVLLHKKPKLELVTENDKKVYKAILMKTKAHKRDYDNNGQLKGDKGEKYTQIIKPMFITSEVQDNKKVGGSINVLKRYRKNTDFIYWDDPNELVERLKLLIASKEAGNTNQDNEIISIIEELQEAGIIKS